MLNIPEVLKNTYRNDMFPFMDEPTPKDLVIYFPALNLTIETDQIVDDSFELNESLCSEEDLVFGSCEASKIKFTVADVEQDLTGQWFTIEQVIEGFDPIPLGKFKVDSCKKQDDLRFKDIIAYDQLKDTDINVSDWYNELFPTGNETYTLKQFRESLLTYLGIEYEDEALPNDDMIVEKTIEPTQISGREALRRCVELNGAFGHINRYGRFTHKILQPAYGLYPAETLYPAEDLYPVAENDTSYIHESIIDDTVSRHERVRFEEYTVKEITKLIIRSEEDDIGAIVEGDRPYIETLTGTSLTSNKTEDDGRAEIIKIEGASSQVQTTTGKNLVEGSAIPVSKSSKWSENGWQGSFSVFDDTSFKLVANNGWRVTKYQLGTQYAGKQVTISFYAKLLSDETTSTSINKIRITNATGTNPYFTHDPVNEAGVVYSSLPTKDTWLYHRCTVTLNTDGQLGFGCHCMPEGQGLKTTWLIKDIQIELGSTATPYEPFVPNSPSPDYPSPILSARNFTITASNGVDGSSVTINDTLCSSLDKAVKDTYEIIDGELYKVQRFAKVDNSKWVKLNTKGNTGHRFRFTDSNIKKRGYILCTHAPYKPLASSYNNPGTYVVADEDDRAFIRFDDYAGTATTEGFISWANSNNFEFYYELKNPIYTKVTDLTLPTFDGLTNITTTANPQVNLTAKLYGNTSNAYVIEGNFLVFGKSATELEQIARNAYGNMAKRPYRPYEADNIGLPYIEVGDALEFTTNDTVVGYVLQRTLTGIQALQDKYIAEGNEEREQNFGINNEIIQLQGKVTRIRKDVEGVRVEVEDLGEELSGEIDVLAGQVVLKVDSSGNVGYVELGANPDTELTSIKLKADNITLEGITTINGGFKVLEDGTIEAVDGKFSGIITASVIRGSEIETYGNDGYIKSTSWDGQTWGVFQNEILINNGVLRCSRTLYADNGATYDWVTSISHDTVETRKIICNSINGSYPVTSDDISDFVSWDGVLEPLFQDIWDRLQIIENKIGV